MMRYVLIFQLMLLSVAWGEENDSSFIGKTEDLEITQLKILDLETAKKIALSENPNLKAAEARVRQAAFRVRQATALYFPRLDASYSPSKTWLSDNAYQQQVESIGIFNPGMSLPDPEDYYQAGVSVSWVLFDGFERWFNRSAARYGFEESQSALKEAQRLLLSAVANAYHNAQLARENVIIEKADIAFNQRQLLEARARREKGTGSLSDELNFEVRTNSARANLINAGKSCEIALIGLAALLGIPESKFPPDLEIAELGDEVTSEMEIPVLEPLIDWAGNHRPDLMKAQLALKRSEAVVGAAKSQFLPQVDLSGSYNGERSNSGDFGEDDFGNRVALSVSYNLFSGGADRARFNEAREKKVEAEMNLESLSISVVSEIQQALVNLQSAQEALILQRSNAELTRKTRDLVEKEYQVGQGSLVRLNEAQRDLTAAQGRLALALVSLRLAWQNLETVTGQILIPFEE